VIFENGQVALEFVIDTRGRRQHTNGRSSCDCDDACPMGYSAAPALRRVRMMSDPRQYAPATLRNRDFILDVLRDVLPMTGVILEIASGSGEHVVHFQKSPGSRFPTFRS
jgi:hypothetical protein